MNKRRKESYHLKRKNENFPTFHQRKQNLFKNIIYTLTFIKINLINKSLALIFFFTKFIMKYNYYNFYFVLFAIYFLIFYKVHFKKKYFLGYFYKYYSLLIFKCRTQLSPNFFLSKQLLFSPKLFSNIEKNRRY